MRRARLAAAGCFLAASAFYLFQTAQLPQGSLEQPGPGLFPMLVGVLLLASSVAFGLQELRPSAGLLARPSPETGRRVAGIVAALAAFCFLLPWLGYGVTALGLLLTLLRLFGLKRWGAVAAAALVATLASYYLFAVILGVPLPAGRWGG
ncbi:MAG TPA: tripartite tricarboxylate transporter TctB family protein [Methylomirabilota bacterium]|nr:tripartite tricarboxylate transporter TctB family protein [Methylomirabilota bacterium]